MLSRPIFSSAAISRMFSGFVFQLALKALKSSSSNTLSGMRKTLLGVLIVVLRAHCENDAPPLQIFDVTLEVQEGFSDRMIGQE